MSKELYIINDFEEFIDAIRALVFNSFGKHSKDDTDLDDLLVCSKPENQEELDDTLSHDEAVVIAKGILRTKKDKYTGKISYILNDDDLLELMELLNDRIVSNILNKLVQMNLVESGYDSETNDFIFWIKDENKEQIKKIIENPETD